MGPISSQSARMTRCRSTTAAAASAAVTRTGVAPETWFGKGKRGPVTARLVVPLTSPGTGVAHVTLRAPHDG